MRVLSDERAACDNSITTSKYSIVSFLPKSLFEQFRRLANLYFIVISLFMVMGQYTNLYESSLSAFSTLGTLVLVMGVTCVIEAKDDIARHRKDAEINSRKARVLMTVSEDDDDEEGGGVAFDAGAQRMAAVVTKEWREVRTGDVIIVEDDQPLPADIVLLGTSSADGFAYVDTCNIDGETNLKCKESPESDVANHVSREIRERKSSSADSMGACAVAVSMSGRVVCDLPNKDIDGFEGTMSEDKPNGQKLDHALGPDNLLLRGSVLRNTKWAIGCVVYIGADTKIMKNSRKTPSKLSNIEKVVNRALLIVLGCQFFLTVVTTILSEYWYNHNIGDDPKKYWYLFPVGVSDSSDEYILPSWIGKLFTFTILFNNFVPISLYVSIEMCNFAHAAFINKDEEMYDEATDTPASCRSSNLCQELGQIEYIFSDKTGTLTRNVMEFKRCSIGGVVYGEMESEKFSAGALMSAMDAGGSSANAIKEFLTVLSVAHTVLVDRKRLLGEDGDGDSDSDSDKDLLTYQAESPDEGALVKAAADLGYVFLGRKGNLCSLNIDTKGSRARARAMRRAISGPKQTEMLPNRNYTVLAVNHFNSTRKRMSVLCKSSDGKYVLLAKGADNVMLERASGAPLGGIETLNRHLTQFAQQGLRTLVIAKKNLSPSAAEAWLKRYDVASKSVDDRAAKMSRLAEEIERGMTIVGATAIEDRLQDDVPATIADMRAAGIKVWVLTGDKLETAVNIGYSCKLLDAEMSVVTLSDPDDPNLITKCKALLNIVARAQKKIAHKSADDSDAPAKRPTPAHKRSLSAAAFAAAMHYENVDLDSLALVITGSVLKCLLDDDERRAMLLGVARACRVVLACRVSPLQKALLVSMVQKGIKPSPITLAIGDGANDVGMIQAARVGVGISGREGMQAVNSSDFAIAQFRFLRRLLLVHGRWNYRRICKLITYSFYKNCALVATIWYYTWFSGFSGSSLYEDLIYAGFNIFLGWPIVMVGIFDKDISARTVLQNPALYLSGSLKLI